MDDFCSLMAETVGVGRTNKICPNIVFTCSYLQGAEPLALSKFHVKNVKIQSLLFQIWRNSTSK